MVDMVTKSSIISIPSWEWPERNSRTAMPSMAETGPTGTLDISRKKLETSDSVYLVQFWI